MEGRSFHLIALRLAAVGLVVFPVVFLMPCRAEVLLRYEMNQATPDFENPVNTVDGGPLQVGTGVGIFLLPSPQPYASAPVCLVAPAASVLPLANSADALTTDCLLSFSFQVGSDVDRLDVDALTFDIARGGADTNRGFGIYVDTPARADVEVKASTAVLTQRPTWDPQVVDLSCVSGLRGLRAGNVVTVKIPFWTTDSGHSLEIDDITLSGTVFQGTNQPALAELRITEITRHGDALSLTWTSSTGRVYAIDYSTDLSRWTLFGTNVPAAPGDHTSADLSTAYTPPGGDLQILLYQMGQHGPQVQDPIKTAVGGDLEPGGGVDLFDVEFSAYPSSPALLVNFTASGANLAEAIANDRLFHFDFIVGSNVIDVDLTSLSFNAARGGSATPRGYGVLVTTPTTTAELVQPATDVETVRPEWDPQFIDLSGVGSLQNLSAGQQVTFTIPTYSPSTINSLEFDDITLRGVVSPPPLPDYVGAGTLFFRVRELPRDPILVEASTRPTGQPWSFYPTRTLEQMPGFLLGLTDCAHSSYGGRLTYQTNATGFFYPLKIGGRWWLVDPDGYLFLHKGVAVISRVNSPGAEEALASLFGTAENWADETTALLRQTGFNGAGAWSETGLIRQAPKPLVYTIIKNFLRTFSATNSSPGYPQVFDPAFESFCQANAQSFASTQSDPYLLGYFSDNELPFSASILTSWLALPPGSSSYDEAWRWLRERYGPEVTAGQVTTQDRYDFLGHVWGRYYSVVNQAIKLHDPNHLYLGSRFYSSDKDRPEIFREVGPHVDVLSVNHYGQWTPDIDRIRMWEQESGKPVIITEYYVKGEDSGMPNNTGAGWVVRTQTDRGHFYQNFTLALLESKVCVGWHWFRYADNDPDAGEDPSNIDSNKGVVSNRYETYDDLLDAMLQFNERAYVLTEYFDGVLKP